MHLLKRGVSRALLNTHAVHGRATSSRVCVLELTRCLRFDKTTCIFNKANENMHVKLCLPEKTREQAADELADEI